MAKIRTSEQLQQLFKERKAIQQRKIEKQKLKYKKASEQIKKQLQKKKTIQENQETQKPSIQPHKLTIYQSPLIERDTAEEDLYQTREELMAAEERGEGAINWSKFDQLVQEFRLKNNITL